MAASLAALGALLLHGPGGRSPPRPRLCLRLRLGAPRLLFVNVCAWTAVPPSRSPAERCPARAGPLQERNNLVLSRSYTIEPFQLKGDLGMMQQHLGGVSETPDPQLSHNTQELTGDELPHALGAEGCSSDPVLLRGQRVTRTKGHLIEEISSTELPEKPSTPVYGMVTVRDANKEPLKMELRIELPQVSSAAESDLRISKDDIIMEVPEKYRLQLDLPERADEETTTAVFNKTKRVLFIKAPVAKADPYPLHSTQVLVTD